MIPPSYDLRTCSITDVEYLFYIYHGYKSVGRVAVYCFGVFENGSLAAAYIWQPPPPQSAMSVCSEAPYGVLALSRMVALPKHQRELNHVSKPLRRQMRVLIDRTRWPVLVTYSDSSLGHTGHVYKCSGWERTVSNSTPIYENEMGYRISSYQNGKHSVNDKIRKGTSTKQRWEHWICPRGEAAKWVAKHGWRRVRTNRVLKSGNIAHKWVQDPVAKMSQAGGPLEYLRV